MKAHELISDPVDAEVKSVGPRTGITHPQAPPGPGRLSERSPAELSDFTAIYQEHSRPIYYLCLRLLGDPTQAEDATHDVFLRAYRKIDQFRGESGIRTWLYRIAINHCQNLSRTWHRRTIVASGDENLWNNAPGNTDTPLRVLETKELGQRIQRTLDQLPEEYRVLLLLVADEKMSYEQIAVLTEQTADAVRGKLHRARKAFHIQFQQSA